VGRVLTLPEVFSDPQVLHNEMVVEFDHSRAGKVRVQGSPIRIDREPARAKASSPVLGEHTLAVLIEMGMTKEQVITLQAAGAAVLA
jgi:crotonobetainyl-CoA:carnitine CoA-transferase CaiB-like acyl-CoA transferase